LVVDSETFGCGWHVCADDLDLLEAATAVLGWTQREVRGERGSQERGRVSGAATSHQVFLHEQCAAILHQVMHMQGTQAWQS
jgi:hypothetical protein